MILHLPHASRFIPENLRDDFLLSDQEFQEELNRIFPVLTWTDLIHVMISFELLTCLVPNSPQQN